MATWVPQIKGSRPMFKEVKGGSCLLLVDRPRWEFSSCVVRYTEGRATLVRGRGEGLKRILSVSTPHTTSSMV